MNKLPHFGVNSPDTTPTKPMRPPQKELNGLDEEAIIEQLANALRIGPGDTKPYVKSYVMPVIRRLLAEQRDHIRDQLLSDKAIDALLQRTLGWDDYDKGTTYEDKPEAEKIEWRDEGRHYMNGPLSAIGLDEERLG